VTARIIAAVVSFSYSERLRMMILSNGFPSMWEFQWKRAGEEQRYGLKIPADICRIMAPVGSMRNDLASAGSFDAIK